MFRYFFLALLVLAAAPLAAQDRDTRTFIGNDAYLAGQNVTLTETGRDDLFAAGERVRVGAALTGNAHIVGRQVSVNQPVGGDLYALGQHVDVSAPVAGDVTAAGQDIRVESPVGGDVRIGGQTVEIMADVTEDLLIGADSALIDGRIGGDAYLGVNSVSFGDGAQIAGTLNVYTDDPDSIQVPASVVPADRVVLHRASDWQGMQTTTGDHGIDWWSVVKQRLGTVVAVTLAAALVAWLAPDFLATLRERALERPLRALWIGFLGLSATIGSLVLFALTGIGLLLVPVSIVLALVLGFAGYVAGVYVLGVALMRLVNQPLPDTLPERAIAALAGAVAAALIAFVPMLGWLFALGLALIGSGALLVRWFAPGFFTAA